MVELRRLLRQGEEPRRRVGLTRELGVQQLHRDFEVQLDVVTAEHDSGRTAAEDCVDTVAIGDHFADPSLGLLGNHRGSNQGWDEVRTVVVSHLMAVCGAPVTCQAGRRAQAVARVGRVCLGDLYRRDCANRLLMHASTRS